jgi:hypothetical protein
MKITNNQIACTPDHSYTYTVSTTLGFDFGGSVDLVLGDVEGALSAGFSYAKTTVSAIRGVMYFPV